jgi:hypothetical protein
MQKNIYILHINTYNCSDKKNFLTLFQTIYIDNIHFCF